MIVHIFYIIYAMQMYAILKEEFQTIDLFAFVCMTWLWSDMEKLT